MTSCSIRQASEQSGGLYKIIIDYNYNFTAPTYTAKEQTLLQLSITQEEGKTWINQSINQSIIYRKSQKPPPPHVFNMLLGSDLSALDGV